MIVLFSIVNEICLQIFCSRNFAINLLLVCTYLKFSIISAQGKIYLSMKSNNNFSNNLVNDKVIDSQLSIRNGNENYRNETVIRLSNGNNDHVNNLSSIPIRDEKINYKIMMTMNKALNRYINHTITALFTPIKNLSNVTTSEGILNTSKSTSTNEQKNRIISMTNVTINDKNLIPDSKT